MKKQALTLALLLALAFAGRGQDPYPLVTIGGVDVSQTEDSITGPNISGYVSYNAETNTLTLKNATINGDINLHGWPISPYVKIKLMGNNTLVGSIDINTDSCSIYGPGCLQISPPISPIKDAIYVARTPLFSLEENATVSISTPYNGINAYYDFMGGDGEFIQTLLYINNSTLIISAPVCANYITVWSLVNCHIVEPSNVVYDPNINQIIFSNGEWALIIPDYLEIRPGGSGVSVQNDPECRIEGGTGGAWISYDGKPTPVEVTDMQGRCVCCTRHQGSSTFIPLHPGLYIVRVGDYIKKVMVL